MTHYDSTRNIHIKFASPEKRDKFLNKLKETEQARMKQIINKEFKERFK